MWLYGMTRQEYMDFLLEYAEEGFDELLHAYSYTVDSIVTDKLREELEEYTETRTWHEAC